MSRPLFQPYTLKSMTLPNRIVMAPMTRSKSPDGIPGDDVAEYYARRSEADVGLIITEGTKGIGWLEERCGQGSRQKR